MVAMVQRLDARSFFSYSQLIVATFLALVLKVFRNRLRCHGQSVADLAPSKLSTFGHSLTIHAASNKWLLEHFFDLPDFFFNLADIVFGFAFSL